MKKWLVGGLLLVLMTAAGCSGKAAQDGQMDMGNMDMNPANIVKVDLSWSPENPKVGETVTFSAKVTQKNEAIDDADKVMFEIGATDSSEPEKIMVKSQGNGIYSVQKSFAKSGSYYVISHVTARDMHVMPKKEFQVSP